MIYQLKNCRIVVSQSRSAAEEGGKGMKIIQELIEDVHKAMLEADEIDIDILDKEDFKKLRKYNATVLKLINHLEKNL